MDLEFTVKWVVTFVMFGLSGFILHEALSVRAERKYLERKRKDREKEFKIE